MADHFADKAQDWDHRDRVRALSAGISQAIVAHTGLRPDMAVMDFGAGTGLISGQVAPHVSQITAVDTSHAMLDKLTAKPELQGKVSAVCQDITQQPLDQRFDLIISAMALHHVEDTPLLMKQFAEHLAPGGSVALADLDQEDGSFHPEDAEGVFHHGFERDTLQQHLEAAGFEGVTFVTAHTVDDRYPVFLVTASKG